MSGNIKTELVWNDSRVVVPKSVRASDGMYHYSENVLVFDPVNKVIFYGHYTYKTGRWSYRRLYGDTSETASGVFMYWAYLNRGELERQLLPTRPAVDRN